MFEENSGDSRFITGVPAVTETVVLTSPACRCGATVVVWPTSTVTASTRVSLSPLAAMVTVYVPGSSSGALKNPQHPSSNAFRRWSRRYE